MTATHRAPDDTAHVATSDLLNRLRDVARPEHVTVDWLVGHLGERSFGLVLFLLGLLGVLPGISGLIAVLLAVPAIEMILGRRRPKFPGFVGRRRVPMRRLVKLIDRAVPLLRRIETIVHPRWRTPFQATKRVVGFVVLLLAATLLAPVPFSNVPPALAILAIALAYLEEDGILLSLALGAGLVMLGVAAGVLWATVKTTGFLVRQI